VDLFRALVATALEALVHVERHPSTRQFTKRVSGLANELGVPGLGDAEAETAYVHRSTLAHGQKLGQLSVPDRKIYALMETTLRAAIVRIIEDDNFGAIFRDEEEIKKKWPL